VIQNAEKVLQLRSLIRDLVGLPAVVDFVVVGSVTGMPPRRVFRHTWRDSIRLLCPSPKIHRLLRMRRDQQSFRERPHAVSSALPIAIKDLQEIRQWILQLLQQIGLQSNFALSTSTFRDPLQPFGLYIAIMSFRTVTRR
jgi:hypothetical protein